MPDTLAFRLVAADLSTLQKLKRAHSGSFGSSSGISNEKDRSICASSTI